MDEFASGLPYAGGYALRDAFGIDVAVLALAVFVVPQLFSLLVEAPLLIWAERRCRQRLLLAAHGGMLLSLLLCAGAWHWWVFAVSWALFFPASGLACALAQAQLVEADPDRREQRMTEWTLFGYLGDLSTPLLLWASEAMGLGWRAAFVATALCLVLITVSLLLTHWPLRPDSTHQPSAPEALEEPTFGQTLRALLQNRELLLWLGAVGLCGFMDEVLGLLVALRMHDVSGSAALVARELMAFTAGGVAGLVLVHRLLDHIDPKRLLALSGVGCAICYGAWLALPGSVPSSILFALAGTFSAAHYPIATARAYAALPGRATLVAAATQPLGVIDLVLPLALGWLVDTLGLGWALLVLLLQPLGLVLVALVARR